MAGMGVIRITVKNGRGLKALQEACAIAADMKDSQPWNDEAKQLVKALRIVAAELKSERAN